MLISAYICPLEWQTRTSVMLVVNSERWRVNACMITACLPHSCTLFAAGMEPSKSGKPTRCAKGELCSVPVFSTMKTPCAAACYLLCRALVKGHITCVQGDAAVCHQLGCVSSCYTCHILLTTMLQATPRLERGPSAAPPARGLLRRRGARPALL